jgi:hypothetical protein
MMDMLLSYRKFLLTMVLLLFVGCATIPKEVVELSYRTGEDMAALHESYSMLIQNYYEKMRDERIDYLDNVWYPKFQQNWMKKGNLIGIAKGEVIWSVEENRLIPTPPNADSKETLSTLSDWVNYALYAYEVKEESLLKPLEEAEEKIQMEVNRAFEQVMRANATVTAHLNSIRKVKQVQDQALEVMNIRDIRNNINDALIQASDTAASELERVRELDAGVDDLTKQVETLTEPKTNK